MAFNEVYIITELVLTLRERPSSPEDSCPFSLVEQIKTQVLCIFGLGDG